MSFTLHGIGVSGGVAIGRARLVSHALLEVPHYVLPKKHVAEEVARFEAAIAATRADMDVLREQIPASAPSEFGAFLSMHQMILADSTLSEAPRQLIEEQQCNAEWALKLQLDSVLAEFDKIDDAYIRERKADVVQVVERVLKFLLGHPSQLSLPGVGGQQEILVAHDLSPADMLAFKQHTFAAFITDVGGATSHTAIIARSLNLPSVLALHSARQLVRDGEMLIVDGEQGVVIVNPAEAILAEYRLRQDQYALERQKLRRLISTPAATLDEVPVELHANIELPQDVQQALANGATGIGLFRSEFLFMNRPDLPSEDEQFEAYREVAVAMGALPVTIRTLDLGADKPLNGVTRESLNPALGLRAIRLCLAEPAMFRAQLRAILRASYYGNVRMMIPMLSNMQELRQTLVLLEQAKESLVEDGIPFNPTMAVGGMIEVPAAALMAEMFARELDFLSIGTNDLIQYTLAIDRADDAVAHLYDQLHPAVLELIAHTIRMADKTGISVSVCGEMAGDPHLTRLLLGLGLRNFSMHPAQLLAVKQQVLQSSLASIANQTQKILRGSEADRIHALLGKMNQVA